MSISKPKRYSNFYKQPNPNPTYDMPRKVTQTMMHSDAHHVYSYLLSLPNDWIVNTTQLRNHFSWGLIKIKQIMAYLHKCNLISYVQQRNSDGTLGAGDTLVLDGSEYVQHPNDLKKSKRVSAPKFEPKNKRVQSSVELPIELPIELNTKSIENNDLHEKKVSSTNRSIKNRTDGPETLQYKYNLNIKNNNNKNIRSTDVERACFLNELVQIDEGGIAGAIGGKDVEQTCEFFDDFWKAYKKKQKKKTAKKVWIHLKLDKIASEIIDHVEKRNNLEWKNTELRFIPCPDTFLRNERWTDVILDEPKVYTSTKVQIEPIRPKYRDYTQERLEREKNGIKIQ